MTVLNRRQFTAATSMAVFATGVAGNAGANSLQPAYKNPSLDVDVRVADLLGRMTLKEKIAQLQCTWQDKGAVQNDKGMFDGVKASKVFPDGLGMLGRPSDRMGSKPTHGNAGAEAGVVNRDAFETATYSNEVQKWAFEKTRLGIPLFLHEESLHGYAAKDATSFPQAIALASSFDPEMITDVFSVCASEMRARGANMALSPVVDVTRDPRWGRIEETYGEDPHLNAEMGKAAVRGFQGDTLPLGSDKVFATLKHMTGHGQPENGTNTGPANISERTLRETFFPPFERIIAETNIAGVMPSYNEIDGLPAHANKWLLKTILRGEWGFKGLTVSDYSAVFEMIARHKLVANASEAGLVGFRAGVDIEAPDVRTFDHLEDHVQAGRIKEAEIDAVVTRVLRYKFLAGLFENPYVDARKAEGLTATTASRTLARKVAGRCAVLLKNRNRTLPLNAQTVGKLLVLGTHARDTPIGGYSDVPRHVVSVLEGLEAEGKANGFEVAYSEGVRLTQSREWGRDEVEFIAPEVNARLIAKAVEVAKTADTIVMVLGDNEQTAREAWADNHLGDRQSLDLIGQQNDLARAIFDLGKPTIVFLLNGRPLSINLLQERADAIIEGWYLGQETGLAAADLLFGRTNPGGKLPVSIARNVGQLPVFYNHKPTSRRGYLDGETTPLYPFGYGLSYSLFEVSEPRLDRTSIAIGETVAVSVEVTNTGEVVGDEVVQLYIRDDVSTVTRPVKELKHFRRVTLKAGETATVRFRITPRDLEFYGVDMKRIVEPGTFTLMAGPDSVRLKTAKLTVI